MKDFRDQIAKPRKVALYAHLTIEDFVTVWEVPYTEIDKDYVPLPKGEWRELSRDGYVRISKPIDMTFEAVTDDSLIQNAMQSLDEEETKLRRELGAKIAALKERKAQLLCLTHSTEAV